MPNNKSSPEKNKIYYKNFLDKNGGKWFCDTCQKEMSYYSRSDHKKTKRHLDRLQEGQQPDNKDKDILKNLSKGDLESLKENLEKYLENL